MRKLSSGIAISVFLLLGLLTRPSAGQAPATKEPSRYALVIGNADYLANGSSLGDLDTACDEAIAFRQSLLQVGWDPDHIHPSMADKSKMGDSQYLRRTYCNLTNAQIRRELSAFSGERIDGSDNPFAVIYYAGHGAQNHSNEYIFGVDSDIDPLRELKRIVKGPDYEIFGDQAVNLTRDIIGLNGLPGQGFLVFIDACRDNPVLNKYRSEVDDLIKKSPKALTAKQVQRISLTYGYPDDSQKELKNIIVAYSTPPGLPADDGGRAGSTMFASTILSMLADEDMQKVNVSTFVDELRLRVYNAQEALDEGKRQYAQRQGLMPYRPVFCFKGCPQPLAIWRTDSALLFRPEEPEEGIGGKGQKTEFIQKGLDQVGAKSRNEPILAFNEYTPGVTDIHRFTTNDVIVSQDTIAPDDIPNMSPASDALRMDIYYCTGDSQSGHRLQLATELAQQITRTTRSNFVLEGNRLAFVRVRELTAALNLEHNFVYGMNTVWVDPRSRSELAWADYVNSKSPTPLTQFPITGNRSKNYLSVYLCEGAEDARATSTVYLQVPSRSETLIGDRMVSYLNSELPQLGFAKHVSAVDEGDQIQSPNSTEVRYFLSAQRSDAVDLSNELSNRLGHKVGVVMLTTGNLKPVNENPVIEIWLGRSDIAAARNAYVKLPADQK
ncbi:caspase family protein [Mesorhizobium sp. Cs1299R1N3]|uniref:caspase family protein n=1 Tax=Mesorhizobium sp. Cs1299R1N3 TaxID=3015173 RepID=UPI00301D4D2E